MPTGHPLFDHMRHAVLVVVRDMDFLNRMQQKHKWLTDDNTNDDLVSGWTLAKQLGRYYGLALAVAAGFSMLIFLFNYVWAPFKLNLGRIDKMIQDSAKTTFLVCVCVCMCACASLSLSLFLFLSL